MSKKIFFVIAVLAFTPFAFGQAPVINSFSPSNGCAGVSINIIGNNFTGATAVKFGNSNATSFKVNSDNSITAINGSGSTGKITVTSPSGTFISTDSFSSGNKTAPAYIMSNAGNLKIVNTFNNSVISSVSMNLGYPYGVCISPNANRFYLADASANAVIIINTVTGLVSDTIQAGINPMGIAISPDESKVYVAMNWANSVEVIDAATQKITATIPAGYRPFNICVSPDGKKVYVSQSTGITIIDAVANSVLGTIPVSAPFCISPDGGKLYVASPSDSLSVFNTTNNTLINRIAGPSSPVSALCISSDGSNLYVAESANNKSIFIINTLANKITDSIAVGFDVNNMNITKDGSRLFLTSNNSSGAVVNTSNNVMTVLSTFVPSQAFGQFINDDIITPCNTCTPTSSDTTVSTCYNYAWNGVNYTQSGIYSHHSINAKGCDSIATLTLNINTSVRSSFAINTCDSFTWRGKRYDKSGDYIDTLASITGCDSIVTMHLSLSIAAAYIPETAGSLVYVVNTVTNTVINQVIVGKNPIAVCFIPGKIYVSNLGGNSVSVIDAASNTVIKTIPVGVNPEGLCTSLDKRKVYVAALRSDSVYVIDVSTDTVISSFATGDGPRAVCISKDGSKLFVTNSSQNNVSVFNTATNTLITNITTGSSPFYICLSPDGSKAYVTNNAAQSVSVIDVTSNTVTATIPVGTYPTAIAISQDGKSLYVSMTGGLAMINTLTNTVTANIPLDGNVQAGLSFSLDGSRLYTIEDGYIINTATNIVSGSLPSSYYYYGESVGNFISRIGDSCSSSCVPTSSDTTAAACNSFTWKGTTYNKSGDYTYYTINAGGCDSAVILHLTLSPTYAYVRGTYSYTTSSDTISIINIGTNTVAGQIARSLYYLTNNSFLPSKDGEKLYLLSNGSQDSIDIFDIPSHTFSASIPIPSGSNNMCLSPDGSRLYISGQNIVSVVDLVSYQLIATLGVGIDPGAMCVSPDGKKVYVTNALSNNISVIDAASNIVTNIIDPHCIDPTGICISPDGRKLYVSGYDASNEGMISIIDIASNTVISIPINGNIYYGLTISPDGKKLYAYNVSYNNVTSFNYIDVLDATSGTPIATIPMEGPFSFNVSPNGSTLYVSGQNFFHLINTSTYKIIPVTFPLTAGYSIYFAKTGIGCNSCMPTYSDTAVFACDSYTWHNNTYTESGIYTDTSTNAAGCDSIATLRLTISASNAYLINNAALYVFNIASGKLTNIMQADLGVTGVYLNPAGQKVYLPNSSGINVSDLTGNSVNARISLPNPVGKICFSPDSKTIYAASSSINVYSYGSNNISVIDAASNTVITSIDVNYRDNASENSISGMCISPDGKRLYSSQSASFGLCWINIINTSTNTIIDTIQSVGPSPLCISSDGSRLYLLDAIYTNTIDIINTSTKKIIGQINITGRSQSSLTDIRLSADDSKLYTTFSTGSNSYISIIDLASVSVTSRVFTNSYGAGYIGIAPHGNPIYIVDQSGITHVLDTASLTLTDALWPAGYTANGVFIGKAGKNLCSLPPPMLLSFNALKNNLNNELIWELTNDKNISSFNIQISTDSVHFTNIKNIAGAGASYSYTDQPDSSLINMNDVIYYRLQIIDNDDNITYSNVTPIYYNMPHNNMYNVYPNPAKNIFYIQEKNITTVTVTDNSGRVVITQGGNPVSINIQGLNSGFYIIGMLDSDGNWHKSPLIIQ